MKKITNKTRVTVVVDGEKITAPAGLLNTICCHLIDAEEYNNEHGFRAHARKCDDMRMAIYIQLNSRGLYSSKPV